MFGRKLPPAPTLVRSVPFDDDLPISRMVEKYLRKDKEFHKESFDGGDNEEDNGKKPPCCALVSLHIDNEKVLLPSLRLLYSPTTNKWTADTIHHPSQIESPHVKCHAPIDDHVKNLITIPKSVTEIVQILKEIDWFQPWWQRTDQASVSPMLWVTIDGFTAHLRIHNKHGTLLARRPIAHVVRDILRHNGKAKQLWLDINTLQARMIPAHERDNMDQTRLVAIQLFDDEDGEDGEDDNKPLTKETFVELICNQVESMLTRSDQVKSKWTPEW